MEKDLELAADVIRRGRTFLLACHVRPDGDALGSALALAIALRRMGKNTIVVSQDGVPEIYSFLPDSQEVVNETPERGFDAAIVIDCETLERLEGAMDAVRSARTIIKIDHHGDGPYGSVNLSDTKAAATAEIVLELIDRLGMNLNEDMAVCLMTAIVADTGAFRFPNVTPRTFLCAARLKSAGASPSQIAELVYETKSLGSMRLLGVALASLTSDESGEIVWSRVTREDFRVTGAGDAETDGIINLIRAVKGARVALLFRETPDGSTLVSLRSKDSTDVSKVAQAFGGGGHPAASGCTVQAALPVAEKLVVEEARKWMAS